MKIKLKALKDFDIGCDVKAGDVLIVTSEEKAETYVERGLAERVTATTKKKKEDKADGK